MVMLASYESSQHCASVVTCLCLITVVIGISPGRQRVVLNLILCFCRPQASAEGLLMATIDIQVHCPGPSASVGLAAILN